MEENESVQYLFLCKEYYINGIIPAISLQMRDENYIKIKSLAEKIIRDKGIVSFSNFFQEGQYLVQLWTAHLIIENTNANDDLKNQALLVVKDYSDNPLVPIVSAEEAIWLKKFYPNA